MLYLTLLLLITLASGVLYGYALRRLTNLRTAPEHVPLPVIMAVPGSLLLCLSAFVLPVAFKLTHDFNLGPLGGAFGAVLVTNLLQFDRLFDARLKRYGTFLRCIASPSHGTIAFGIGAALWQVLLATELFCTPATQILLTTAVGGAILILEALILPYFITVDDQAERTRFKRGAWRMAVLRANLLFLCGTLIYGGLFVPTRFIEDHNAALFAIIIVGILFLSSFLTSHWDSVFLTDEVVAPATTVLTQENPLAANPASIDYPPAVSSAEIANPTMDAPCTVQRLGNGGR